MIAQTVKHNYSATSATGQIPLCMIGDSITWAEDGDHWRKELLKHLPNLAFVGSHTACFGYSHAGEGGNTTNQVVARMAEIPDCPYYNLLIGTNNNSIQEQENLLPQAQRTASAITEIVNLLLAKNGTRKVFLASLMPCYTDNPLRDTCNQATNKILRQQFTELFPDTRVIWVEYDKPVRKVANWEEIIRLHPTPEGYAIIAKITANAITEALELMPFRRVDNSGVQVVNLLGADHVTECKIIPGWYTLSFQVKGADENSRIQLCGQNQQLETPFNMDIPVPAGDKYICKCFYTQAAGYGYTPDYLVLETEHCTISEVLLEKMRPSRQASIYHNTKSYIDTVSPVSNGELLEYKQ